MCVNKGVSVCVWTRVALHVCGLGSLCVCVWTRVALSHLHEEGERVLRGGGGGGEGVGGGR